MNSLSQRREDRQDGFGVVGPPSVAGARGLARASKVIVELKSVSFLSATPAVGAARAGFKVISLR